MNNYKKKLLILIVIVIVIIGGISIYRFNYLQSLANYSVNEINADNSIINNKIVRGSLDGLHLENITLKDTTFQNLSINQAIFKNVVFENCTFVNVQINNSAFDTVTFKSSLGTYYNPGTCIRTEINSSVFSNVIFDGVTMERSFLSHIQGGEGNADLTFKNMHSFIKYDPLTLQILSGTDLDFHIDKCDIKIKKYPVDSEPENIQIANLDKKSTIYVTNSTIDHSGFYYNKGKTIYIETSVLQNINLYNTELTVIKNCDLENVSVNNLGDIYFINNKINKSYVNLTGKEVHVFGDNQQVSSLRVHRADHVYLYDMELKDLSLTDTINSLNLHNVKITSGCWDTLKINNGNWENVEFSPDLKILIKNGTPQINGIKAYNLILPDTIKFYGDGEEFKPENINIQRVDKPFEWPNVHVPSAQELGLTN